MDLKAGLFYAFSAILLFAAFRVVTARNPVHAALYLVLSFFQAAMIWMLLKAEFLAIVLVLVYVGAVMVLFLFVVMMLDISFDNLRKGAMQYVPLGILIGAVLLAEMGFMMYSWDITHVALTEAATAIPENVSNTHALGRILYTYYALPFQVAGVILLVAMIGAICLTLRVRGGVLRQKISDQVHIKREDVVELRKVQSGQGV